MQMREWDRLEYMLMAGGSFGSVGGSFQNPWSYCRRDFPNRADLVSLERPWKDQRRKKREEGRHHVFDWQAGSERATDSHQGSNGQQGWSRWSSLEKTPCEKAKQRSRRKRGQPFVSLLSSIRWFPGKDWRWVFENYRTERIEEKRPLKSSNVCQGNIMLRELLFKHLFFDHSLRTNLGFILLHQSLTNYLFKVLSANCSDPIPSSTWWRKNHIISTVYLQSLRVTKINEDHKLHALPLVAGWTFSPSFRGSAII